MGQSRSLATGRSPWREFFCPGGGNLRLAGAQGGGTFLILRKILHKFYTNFTQIFSLSFDFSPLPAISCREDDAARATREGAYEADIRTATIPGSALGLVVSFAPRPMW